MNEILDLKKILEEKKASKEELILYQAKIGKDGKLSIISFPVVWTEARERKNIWGVSLERGKFIVPKSFVDETNFKGNRNYKEEEIGHVGSSRAMSAVSINPHHALVLLNLHFKKRIEDLNKRMHDVKVLKDYTLNYLDQISNKLTEVEKEMVESNKGDEN